MYLTWTMSVWLNILKWTRKERLHHSRWNGYWIALLSKTAMMKSTTPEHTVKR